MGYRNITVDGKVYKYTVGKKYASVRGVGVFYIDPHETHDKIAITPARIAEFIRENIGEHNEQARDS